MLHAFRLSLRIGLFREKKCSLLPLESSPRALLFHTPLVELANLCSWVHALLLPADKFASGHAGKCGEPGIYRTAVEKLDHVVSCTEGKGTRSIVWSRGGAVWWRLFRLRLGGPLPPSTKKLTAYVQAMCKPMCIGYVRPMCGRFQASGPILGPRHVFSVRGDAPQTRRRNAYFQMCRVNA